MKDKTNGFLSKATVSVIAILLVCALVIGLVPNDTLAATADGDTSGTYTASLGDNASTEFAGRIWTDKSVYTDDASFSLYGGGNATIQKEADEDFLVTYSALGTSQAISGKTVMPLDVVFIIDLSSSMINNRMDNGQTRLANATVALNDAVETLLAVNEYVRVGVVGFNGTSYEILPLDHYEKYNGRDFFTCSGSTITYNARSESKTFNNQTISTRSGTNVQKGVHTGMNVLAEETETKTVINGKEVQRVPAVIMLTDGEPSNASSAATWWDVSGDTSYKSPAGNNVASFGLRAIMTASYMKAAINRNYGLSGTNSVKVYSIGVGITDLSSNMKNLAYATIDPANNLSKNNSYSNDMRNTWTTYANGGTPTLNGYRFTHPSQYDVVPADKNISALYYVDTYYDVDNAESLNDVFSSVVSNISIAAVEVPTELKGSDPMTDGYITYTDPLGEYTEVKDVKAILYAGTQYTAKSVSTSGAVTTYTFSGEVHSAVYGDQNLSNIIITVTKDADENETIQIKIPAAVMPVRVNTVALNADGSVDTHTNNGAYPVRVIYSVGVRGDVLKTEGGVQYINTEKVSTEYIENHKNADGSVDFYSNLYTGTNVVNGHTAGNTTVEFEPSHSNPFYYIQEDVAIYHLDGTQVLAAEGLDDDQQYHYETSFYHGTHVDGREVVRTGAQLKKTDIIEKGGYLYRAAGSPRLNRILEFEGTKSNNTTGTAADFYAPTFEYAIGSVNAYDGKYVIYLGNNGIVSKLIGGNLAISKTVTATEGLTAPEVNFEFTVDFNGSETLAGTYNYEVIDSTNSFVSAGSVSDGGIIILKDGQTATIQNLPPATTYKVTEKAVDGFVTSVNGVDSAETTGTIQAGVISEAKYMNHYEVQEVVLPAFGGTKILDGRVWENGVDSFTFLMTPYNDAPLPNGYDSVNGLTVNTAVAESGVYKAEFQFGEIAFEMPGVYRYIIVEKHPESADVLPGMTYSSALYRLVVVVEDNGDGTLKITTSDMQKLYTDAAEPLFTYDADNNIVLNAGEEAQDTVVFTNIYSVDDVVGAPVAVKEYTDHFGSKPLASGMFKFELLPVGVLEGATVVDGTKDQVPMPVDALGNRLDSQITENEGHNITFGQITFRHDDVPTGKKEITFRYQMKEVLPAEATAGNQYTVKGMKYDPTVYDLDVTLTIDAGSDALIVIVESSSGSTPVFKNEYTPDPVTVSIEGVKTLKGRDMLADESFVFNLMPDTATGLATVNGMIDISNAETSVEVTGGQNGVANAFDFGEITFKQPGTYTFYIREEIGTAGGVTYDEHVTEVTITVTDVDGKLQAEVEYSDGEDGAVFVNLYQPTFDPATSVDLMGNKVLVGQSLEAGEFYFAVEELNDKGEVISSKYVPNDAEGKIIFLEDVTYDRTGTYVYRIYEDIPTLAVKGMTYDTNKYIFTVTVVDDMAGNLKASLSGDWLKNEATDESVSEIKFTNVYVSEPKEVEIHTMKKVISGDRNKALEADEFKFVLNLESASAAEGILLPGETTADFAKNLADRKVQVGNAADGSIRFGSMTFLKAGTYTVVYKEVIPADADKLPGVTYTTEEKRITYKVTDDSAGNLSVTIDGTTGAHTFTNVYETKGEFDLTIEKVLKGRTWLATDAFRFEVVVLDPATQQAITDGKLIFPVDDTDHIKTLEIAEADADKKVTSPKIVVKAPGTYQFVVREVTGTIPGINYDSKPHTITVIATDNADGTLTIGWTDDNAALNSGADVITFTNTYDANSTELSGHDELKITKDFTGRENNEWLDTDSFTFSLTAGDAATAAAITAGNVELTSTELVVTNANRAYPHFGNIIFHEQGTYTFIVTEIAPAEAITNKDGSKTYQGITYDVSPRTVVVEVVDNAMGELVATRIDANPLIFTNTYAQNELTLSGSENLEIAKTLVGRNWFESDSFTFELIANNQDTLAAITAGEVVLPEQTLTIHKDGSNATAKGAFGDIVFKKAGTYEFAIREVIPAVSADGMTYDVHTERVVVTVVDNEKGQLVASGVTSMGEKEFINLYDPDAIQIVVTGQKILSVLPLNTGDFSFKLTPVSSTLKDVNGNDVIPMPAVDTVENGDAEDASKISFGGISYEEPGTYVYEISEIAGSIPGVTYDDEKVSMSVVINNNEEKGVLEASVSYTKGSSAPAATFTFNNVYTTTPADPVTLSAIKKVNGINGNVYTMVGGEFQFMIEPSHQNPAADPIAKATKANLIDGTVNLFENAVYTQPGTYHYTVHELDGTIGGITYDDSIYEIKVVVADNTANAQLEAVVTITQSVNGMAPVVVSEIVFNNSYTPDTVSALIYGHKNLLGGHKELAEGEFQFKLEAVSGIELDALGNEQPAAQIPMPADRGDVVSNLDTGLFQFGRITYERPGIYTYKVSEVPGQLPGYSYSDASYHVTVTVTDISGVLTATVSGLEQVVFNNYYIPAAVSVTIDGTKILNGRSVNEGEFVFDLLDADGNLIREAANIGNTFTFDAIEYTKVGVYHYTLVERATHVDGVTYDSTVYGIKVTVADPNYQGQLTAVAEYLHEGNVVETATFTNVYKAAPTSIRLGAVKSVLGRPLNEKEFNFVLVDENGKEDIVANHADGSVEFAEIHFEEAGTYVYTIFEQIPVEKEAAITYDERIYTVTVTVEDMLNGHLKVTKVDYAVANGEFEDATNPGVVFTNIYTPKAVSVNMSGKKDLIGRGMFDNEFEFALINMDGQEVVARNQGKTFSFENISFDKVGTYYFKIVEKDTKLAGITYNPDNVIYDVKVEVTDDGYTGKLAAEVSYMKDGNVINADDVVFTNIYTSSPVAFEVNAIKKLTGRALNAGEFKFVLEDAQGNKYYAVNAADGSISFETITFDKAGTYTYKLYEEKGSLEYVTYDETVYSIVITVTDDLKGNLVAEANCDAKDLIFNNEYKEPVMNGTHVDSGDRGNIGDYAVVSLISMLALIVLMIFKRKRTN